MPEENNKLNDINDKLQVSLEKQAGELGKTIDDATKQLVSGIKSSNLKFVDELDAIKGNILDSVQKATGGGKLELDIDKTISLSSLMGDMTELKNLNFALAFKFLKVRSNILQSVDKATKGGNLDLDIDKQLKLSDILGESPKINIIHALRWLRIKRNILQKVEKATEGVELEIDPKMSLNDVLGATPEQDFLTKTRFFLIRQGLLNRISKAAKKFDPQEAVDNITGGVGGGAPAVGGAPAGAASSVIPPDALEAITNTSSSLESLVESSEGDVLQARENRKEDIARQERQIEALNEISDNDSKDSGPEKKAAGGVLSSIKDSIKSKFGFGGAKAAAGGAAGGAMAGIGKGAGAGISGLLKGLGKGLKAISNPKYLIGAGVLIALGSAMFITGKAFQQFADINWKGVGIGIGVLAALGLAAFGLSFISPAIFIGAAAIAALGAAMIPAAGAFMMFGKALELMTPFLVGFGMATSMVIEAVGDFLSGFIDSLVLLSSVGPGLYLASGGIAAVSAALVAFAAAAAVGGVLNFFSDDPVGKFIELGKVGPDLETVAGSIDSLGEAIQNFDTGEPDKLEEFVDQIKRLSKLKLKTVAEVMKNMSVIATGVAAAPKTVGSASTASLSNKSVNKFSDKTFKQYGEVGAMSNKAIGQVASGDEMDPDIKKKVLDGLARSNSSQSAEGARKKLRLQEHGLRTGQISEEQFDLFIKRQILKSMKKSGKHSESDMNKLGSLYGADHNEFVAERRKILLAENSSGAQLETNQRQIDQMKEAEALKAASNSVGNTAVVNNAGDQNITNTTINSDRHIDRTLELVAACF